MQTLGNMLQLSKPDLTKEQWEAIDKRIAEEDAQERESLRISRIMAAGIPEEFKDAEINKPDCIEWVQNPNYGLILTGKQGRGKSYEACAVLKIMASIGTIRFTTLKEIMTEIQSANRDMSSERQIINSYTAVHCLCLDNLGCERLQGYDSPAPVLHAIIDRRTKALRPTIITTSLNGTAFTAWLKSFDIELAKDIASRLKRYRTVEFYGEDRRSQ